MEKTCTGCVVSAGTHKPAEALHQQIDEPQAEAMRLADECEESATHWVHEIDTRFKAAKMLRAQQARIAELEAQLEAIGAGGVEPLHKQAAQEVQPAVPDGWKLIAVNPEFDTLMFRLESYYENGYLVRCADLIEPWLAFDYDSTTNFLAATQAAKQGEKP